MLPNTNQPVYFFFRVAKNVQYPWCNVFMRSSPLSSLERCLSFQQRGKHTTWKGVEVMYKAYVFDAYGTVFDVHSVMEKIHQFYPEKGEAISQKWRSNQIHYFLVRQLIQDYRPFTDITRWALLDALSTSGVEVKEEVVSELMEEYQHLSPYEEVASMSEKHPDKTFTIFSNGTTSMLEPLLENNQLSDTFQLLSADDVQVYKPHPEAYAYAQEKLGLNKEDILFFSSNPWDITGAASYGFHTAWVNRKEQKWPELGIEPTYIIDNLINIPQ